MRLSILLLAGGLGHRMGAPTPKQFLQLNGKPLVRYSFETLFPLGETIVVAASAYRHLFPEKEVIFADPGERRQDSVYSALQQATGEMILVHDAARPFVSLADLKKVLNAADETGAAALGYQMTATIKEATQDGFVFKTLDRSRLWELYTPQVLRRDLLEKGFQEALRQGLTVTDDVSLAELIGAPIKLVSSAEPQFKITTPQDLVWAEFQCRSTNSR